MKALFLAIALFATTGTTLAFGAEPAINSGTSYYDQFGFRVQGNCSNQRGLWFIQTSSWFTVDLGRDSHGRRQYADMSLQLFPNGKYWMNYTEVSIIRVRPDGTVEGVLTFSKQLEGNWGIYGNQLAVGGLFTATPVTLQYQGGRAPGFAARFFNAIHHPLLKARPVAFGAVASKTGPRGIDVAHFCHP